MVFDLRSAEFVAMYLESCWCFVGWRFRLLPSLHRSRHLEVEECLQEC